MCWELDQLNLRGRSRTKLFEIDTEAACDHSLLARSQTTQRDNWSLSNARYVKNFEEIIFITRKPPTTRRKPKNVPAFIVEEAPPVTGNSMVFEFIDLDFAHTCKITIIRFDFL